MRKIGIVLLLMLCALSAYAHSIRFGTEAAYPPFESQDASGNIHGFDIEIAKALCDEMKKTCSFHNDLFGNLLTKLNDQQFDAVIASLNAANERKRKVAFSSIYYEPTASFIAPINKHYTMQNITGKNIGVQQGSTFYRYLKKKYGARVKISSFRSIQDAFLALAGNHVDMVLGDTSSTKSWLNKNSHYRQYGIVTGPIINNQYFGEGYAIALRKKDTDLLKDINHALAIIKSNGKYNTIYKKYFGA